MDQVKGKSASEQNQGDGCNSDKKTADMTPFQTGCKFNILTLNTAGLDSSLKVNVQDRVPTILSEAVLPLRRFPVRDALKVIDRCCLYLAYRLHLSIVRENINFH